MKTVRTMFAAAGALLVLLAHPAGATLATYPWLDDVYAPPADGTVTFPVGISASPDHTFLDTTESSGTADPTMTRYYGGRLTFLPTGGASGNVWGSWGEFAIRADNSPVLRLQAGAGYDGWRYIGDASSVDLVGPTRTGTFDFVIKVEDLPWNVARSSLFLGTNANTVAEAVPDYIVTNVINRVTTPLNTFVVSARSESWAGTPTATLTVERTFSNTEWTPVSAVPEPSAIGLLGIAGLSIYLQRRRVRRGN